MCAVGEQHAPSHCGNKCQDTDYQPQQDVDGHHHLASSRYLKPARTAIRASSPAMIGRGSAATMRQITKSGPKNGSSQTSARVYPINVQLTMKVTTAPASAPIIRNAPATG